MNEHQTLADAAGMDATNGAATRLSNVADTQFVELLCADSTLLRLEFDAIIAANFSPPGTGQRFPRSPRRELIRSTGRLPPPGMRRPVLTAAGSPRRRQTVPDARERSPPIEAVPRRW
jgi:hypothetical protein